MIRRPAEAEARTLSAAEVLFHWRQHAIQGFKPVDIRPIQSVLSGLALIPQDTAAHTRFLCVDPVLITAFKATRVEPQAGRDRLFRPFAPKSPYSHLFPPASVESDLKQYTNTDYSEGLKAVLGFALVDVRPKENGTPHTITLFVKFPAGSVRPSRAVSLLGASVSLVPSKSRPCL